MLFKFFKKRQKKDREWGREKSLSFIFFDTFPYRVSPPTLLTPGPNAISLRIASKVKHMVKVKFIYERRSVSSRGAPSNYDQIYK